MKFSISIVLALVLGGVSVVGWAPFELWIVPLLTACTLFALLINSKSPLTAGFVGLAFGTALHSVGHAWVMTALHSKTGLALLPAALSTGIFILYLAIFTAIPSLLLRVMYKSPVLPDASISGGWRAPSAYLTAQALIVAFASLLTFAELGRTMLFNGFTSLSLGYSLVDTWLAGFAPVLGTYGVSWLGYYVVGAIAVSVSRPKYAPFLLGLVAVIVVGGLGLSRISWVKPSGTPLSYRLIQSNVLQEHKFDPQYQRRHMERLVATIEEQSADIVITPETAFTVFLNDLPTDTLSRLRQFSERTQSHLFLGIATLTPQGNGYNSIVQITPKVAEMMQYHKVRLMPFGEYTPPGFGWFTRSLSIPLKDLSSGDVTQQPFIVGSQQIGTLICHEDLVGRDMRRWLPSVNILINPSNLAWFDDSLAIAQRMQIVRMRALEAGRPVLRVANTGITAHVNHHGKILDQIPKTKEGVLIGTVQPMQGSTPYTQWGDWLVAIWCAVSLLVAVGVNVKYGVRP